MQQEEAILRHSKEPTIQSLLANTGHGSSILPAHMRTGTNRMDIDDKTMTGLASWRRGQGFKQWEQALFKSPEVKRKADMAQLCPFSLNTCIVVNAEKC